MPCRLRLVLLLFAAVALAMSPGVPALASNGPALPPGMVHHDSSAWSLVPTTTQRGSILNGVSCVSATDCLAVGSVNAPPETLVESWNGTAWSVVPNPNPGSHRNTLYGVSCVSATDCIAVGFSFRLGRGLTSKTLVESWNGTAWSVVPSPNPGSTHNDLFGVSCVSATDCTAVGESESHGAETTLVESWNGTAWSVVPSPNKGSIESALNGVSCVSATACTAVGEYTNAQDNPSTLAESWNGTAWSVVPSPNKGAENYLSGVSCVSATDCTAVGTGSTGTARPLVESWDGTAWSVVPSPNPGGGGFLTGVSCVSATACTAVGRHFPTRHTVRLVTLVELWNGTGWSVVPSPNKVVSSFSRNYLNGVSCVRATACNAVGLYQKPTTQDKSLAESNDVVPSRQ